MLREKARLITISLLIGLIAAVGFYLTTAGKGLFSGNSTAKKDDVKTVSCVVAAKDIDRRARLEKNMLKVVRIPKEMLHPEAVTNPDDAVGYFTEEKLFAGEMLIKPHLSKIKAPGELSYAVPAGKRAVTVAVNPASGVGNMLRPGDRVDVLSHIGQQTAGEDVVFTLVENIMVLAIDDRTGLDDEKETKIPAAGAAAQNIDYKTVTLAVSPQESNILAYAESVGEIRLSLHSAAGGNEGAFRKPLSPGAMAGLYGFKIKENKQGSGAAQAAAPATQPAPSQPPVATVQPAQAAPAATQTPSPAPPADPENLIYVLRGSEMTSVSVQPDDQQKKN